MNGKVVIGEAVLYRADCREILPHLEGIELIVTDPPYGTGGWRRTASGQGRDPSAALVREPWDDGDLAWLTLCRGAPVLTFWPPQHMPQLLAAAHAAGYAKTRFLYMRKRDPRPSVAGRTAWSVEPIAVLSQLGFQLYGGTDVIDTTVPRLGRDAEAVGHPYQKPLAVMLWLIAKTRDAAIVDPFMGSGTTGLACRQLGRRFVGIERDPDSFTLACRRLTDAERQIDLPWGRDRRGVAP
ncbi:MAG TPA: DNA methyltransferase [Stellaceae bacterium]|nr:DNA methyltransferase [Stellaceae bacterium]